MVTLLRVGGVVRASCAAALLISGVGEEGEGAKMSADELGEEGGEDQDYEAYYEDRMSIK